MSIERFVEACNAGVVKVRPRVTGQVQLRVPRPQKEDLVILVKPHMDTDLAKFLPVKELKACKEIRNAISRKRIEVV